MDSGPANIEVVNKSINYNIADMHETDFKDSVSFSSTMFTQETKALREVSVVLPANTRQE